MKKDTLISVLITLAIIFGLVFAELFATCDTKTGSNPVYSTECQK